MPLSWRQLLVTLCNVLAVLLSSCRHLPVALWLLLWSQSISYLVTLFSKSWPGLVNRLVPSGCAGQQSRSRGGWAFEEDYEGQTRNPGSAEGP